MQKYNLGSGPKKEKGFLNVDALPWDGATDVIWDLTKVPYGFVLEPIDELLAIEVLEHIGFRDVEKVVGEWYHILKDGGKLTIQVPDCGKMMLAYADGLVCGCVPHKADKLEDFKANPWCTKCNGKAIVNTKRWQYAFTGAQKHEYDIHRNFFTKGSMEKMLKYMGFQKVVFKEHPFKIIVTAIKQLCQEEENQKL